MKYILFLFAFLPLQVFSQDWSLFPLDQRSFYQNTATGNISFTKIDSFIETSGSLKDVFDEFPSVENAGDCGSVITNAVSEDAISCMIQPSFPFLDSIVYRNDTAFIYGSGISYEMFFLNKADINQSWNIMADVSENILIKCTSIDTQSIFGVLDSIRTYSFYSTSGSTILSSYKIVLSKNYGLLNFVDFIYLTEHTELSTPVYYELKGAVQGGLVYGFSLPSFNDYFPYTAGDKLYWKYTAYYSAEISTYFRNDSITEKTIYDDSIVVIYDAVGKEENGEVSYFDHQKNVFVRSEFEPLLASAPGWLSVAYNMYGSALSDMLDIWCTGLIDSDLSDSLVIRSFSTGIDFIIISDCIVDKSYDSGGNFSISTRQGITSFGGGASGYTEQWYLIGSVINDEETGITSFKDEVVENVTISIFPNPATSYIKIGLPENNYTYKIYNCNGQLILSGMLKNNLIDIAELAGGIYFLEINNESETANIKFIKM